MADFKKKSQNFAQITWMGTIDSDLCVHCWVAPKTEDRIFLECRFANSIWRNLKVSVGYGSTMAQNLDVELLWLLNTKSSVKIQQDGMRLLFSAFLYWVWRARNENIFQGKSIIAAGSLRIIFNDVQLKLTARSYNMEEGPELMLTENRWGVSVETKRKRLQRV